MSRVTLLGCHHDDPYIEERLLRALDKEKPTHITMEICEENMLVRQQLYTDVCNGTFDTEIQHEKIDEEHFPLIRHLRKAMLQNFLAPYNYAHAHSIPIDCIDAPHTALWRKKGGKLSREYLQYWKTMILSGYDSVKKYADYTDAQYRKLSRLFKNGMEISIVMQEFHDDDYMRESFAQNRDDVPCARIIDIQQSETADHILHVCGTAHTYEDPWKRTLFSKLKHKNPQINISRKILVEYS